MSCVVCSREQRIVLRLFCKWDFKSKIRQSTNGRTAFLKLAAAISFQIVTSFLSAFCLCQICIDSILEKKSSSFFCVETRGYRSTETHPLTVLVCVCVIRSLKVARIDFTTSSLVLTLICVRIHLSHERNTPSETTSISYLTECCAQSLTEYSSLSKRFKTLNKRALDSVCFRAARSRLATLPNAARTFSKSRVISAMPFFVLFISWMALRMSGWIMSAFCRTDYRPSVKLSRALLLSM